jgi:H/ACA ribonucleoprotein complex subunit 1
MSFRGGGRGGDRGGRGGGFRGGDRGGRGGSRGGFQSFGPPATVQGMRQNTTQLYTKLLLTLTS